MHYYGGREGSVAKPAPPLFSNGGLEADSSQPPCIIVCLCVYGTSYSVCSYVVLLLVHFSHYELHDFIESSQHVVVFQ